MIERGLAQRRIAELDRRVAVAPLPDAGLSPDRAATGSGVTLVNIGVGPSNAKNITDHLAVLRPHCWLMVGHCGGLRQSQTIGDYVLAHGYLRRDHILDDAGAARNPDSRPWPKCRSRCRKRRPKSPASGATR